MIETIGIIVLLLSSLAFADGFVLNGYGTNETQLGLMKADLAYNGFVVKGSLTEGQPISPAGTFSGITGQIGYLILPLASIVIPGGITIPAIPLTTILTITSNEGLGSSSLIWIIAGAMVLTFVLILHASERKKDEGGPETSPSFVD